MSDNNTGFGSVSDIIGRLVDRCRAALDNITGKSEMCSETEASVIELRYILFEIAHLAKCFDSSDKNRLQCFNPDDILRNVCEVLHSELGDEFGCSISYIPVGGESKRMICFLKKSVFELVLYNLVCCCIKFCGDYGYCGKKLEFKVRSGREEHIFTISGRGRLFDEETERLLRQSTGKNYTEIVGCDVIAEALATAVAVARSEGYIIEYRRTKSSSHLTITVPRLKLKGSAMEMGRFIPDRSRIRQVMEMLGICVDSEAQSDEE